MLFFFKLVVEGIDLYKVGDIFILQKLVSERDQVEFMRISNKVEYQVLLLLNCVL